jgi:HEAT repeat protein
VKVISHIGGIEAIPLLLRAIRDDHLFIRRRAEQALIDMGDTAVGALTPLVSTGDPVFPRIIRKISERKEEHAGEPDKPGTIVAPDEAGSHEQT